MKAGLAIVALLLAIAPPAHAGWRGAEWGMTVEQVVTAMSGEAKARKPPRVESDKDSIGAEGSFVWDKDEFKTIYYFRKGELTSIGLEWKKRNVKPADCQRVIERIGAAHGQPQRTSDQTIIKLVIWHDKPTETRIRVLISGGNCGVYYERLSDFEAIDLANPGHQIKPPKVTGGVGGSPVDAIQH